MRNRAWLVACMAVMTACTPGLALAESASASSAYDKLAVPTVDKDISLDGEKWSDEVDASSFGHLYYRVTGTLPEYVEPYDKYPYAFVDTCEGTIDVSEETVRVNLVHGATTKDVTEAFETTFGGGTMTVTCADLKKAFPNLDPEDKLVLTYEANLGADPDTGLADPNQNACKLTYMAERAPVASALPGGYGLGVPQETPESLTYAYTYAIELTKVVEGEKTPLANAGFALRDAEGRWLCRDGWSDDVNARRVVRTDEEGRLTLGDIATGTVTLVEVEPPEGYGKCKDIRLTLERGRNESGRPYLGAEADGAEVTSVEAAGGIVRLLVGDPRGNGATTGASQSTNGTTSSGSSSTGGSGGVGSPASRESLSKTGDTTMAPFGIAALGVIALFAGRLRHGRE